MASNSTAHATAERGANSIAVTIAEALAKELNCSVYELDPLYEVIDTDAVEALFAEDTLDTSVKISFDYQDRRVVVTSEMNVCIEERG